MSTDARPAATALTPAHLRAYMARLNARAERSFARDPHLRVVLEQRLRERREREGREDTAAD